MADFTEAVQGFLNSYERANTDFDVSGIGACYADVFLFGTPAGTQAVKKEDFLRILPRRKEYFKSVGLVSSQVKSVETTALDQKYVLAKVFWQMRLAPSGKDTIEMQNPASYVLSSNTLPSGESRFEIVLQIDHQDLAQKIQELGLA